MVMKNMETSEKLLKKKAWIKEEITRRRPDISEMVWKEAHTVLDDILSRYKDIPKGERMHTDGYIFPSAAVYLTLKKYIGSRDAYDIIESSAVKKSTEAGKSLAKLMRIPRMKSLFVKVWDPMTRKMFGESSGFKNVFYPKQKGSYKMDITDCPYHKYFTLLGCPELNKVFCDNDERCYGNLPGIEFKRTTTIGKGGSKCDFYIGLRK